MSPHVARKLARVVGAREAPTNRPSPTGCQPATLHSQAAARDRRACACGGTCPRCRNAPLIQAKLAVSQPHDLYEDEADHVAEHVLAKPACLDTSSAPPRIQHYGAHAGGELDTAPASVDRVLSVSGSPLEPALRSDMEARFGQDFSEVRVHSGAAAEQSASDVNARAYTVGRDVVFGSGQFAPGTTAGYRVLAHELTHVIQ